MTLFELPGSLRKTPSPFVPAERILRAAAAVPPMVLKDGPPKRETALKVLEAEGMAYFVGDNVLQEPAHQVVGKRQLLGARIERANLHEVPVAGQVHDVVIELDVGIEDLAGARVAEIGRAHVFGGGGEPADYRI